jgi:hypothetical protein
MNNNHFKIGDSVYCHTDFYEFGIESPVYKKGEVYIILDIHHRMPFSLDFSERFICLEIEGYDNIKIAIWLVVSNHKKDINLIKDFFIFFDDYFISLKEHRMLKLNSLNSIYL